MHVYAYFLVFTFPFYLNQKIVIYGCQNILLLFKGIRLRGNSSPHAQFKPKTRSPFKHKVFSISYFNVTPERVKQKLRNLHCAAQASEQRGHCSLGALGRPA